jgi:hypothetical protein
VYLEHLMESLEKTHITRVQAYNVHATIAVDPNLQILTTKVERQVAEGIFWIQHAGIVEGRNDRAQPPADVHDLSFSL